MYPIGFHLTYKTESVLKDDKDYMLGALGDKSKKVGNNPKLDRLASMFLRCALA